MGCIGWTSQAHQENLQISDCQSWRSREEGLCCCDSGLQLGKDHCRAIQSKLHGELFLSVEAGFKHVLCGTLVDL